MTPAASAFPANQSKARAMIPRRLFLALVAVPLVAILALTGFGLWTALQESRRAAAGADALPIATVVLELIHDLQRERGYSAVWVASDGRLFQEALQRQRLRVDARRTTLRSVIAGLHAEVTNPVVVRAVSEDMDDPNAFARWSTRETPTSARSSRSTRT